MTGAELVVAQLAACGVDYVFGVPGDTSMSLYDAFARSGRIKHIAFRDERSAVFAADAYARVKGSVGVADLPSGAGALYSVGGVSEAHKSCSAVVCIATDIPLTSEETEALTELKQEQLFAAISKWSTRVKTVERLPALMRKAFRLATSGRPGATVLTIPQNVLSDEYAGCEELRQCGAQVFPRHRPRPGDDDVEEVIKLLFRARRPVILAGGGVLISQAWKELQLLCRRLDIPVATSINGKGAIAEGSRQSIGVVGANGGRTLANRLVQEADFLLVLGSKLNRVTTLGGSLTDGKIICQVDIDAEALGNNVHAQVQILADAREFLVRLLEGIEAGSQPPTGVWHVWTDRVERETRRDFHTNLQEPEFAGRPINPHRVVRALQNVLPEDAIIVADAGTPTPFMAAYYRIRHPGRHFISPRGHGGLGFALPAALGAKLARPDALVVGMFGDGSFGMSMGDLETISRVGVPVVLLNFDNRCYGWIKALQKLYFGERYFSVDFRPVDNVMIARAFGIDGRNVSDPDALEDTLRDALRSDGPFFINIESASPAEVTPPVAKWLKDEKVPPEQRGRLAY